MLRDFRRGDIVEVRRGKWSKELARVLDIRESHRSITVRLMEIDQIVKVPIRACSLVSRQRSM